MSALASMDTSNCMIILILGWKFGSSMFMNVTCATCYCYAPQRSHIDYLTVLNLLDSQG